MMQFPVEIGGVPLWERKIKNALDVGIKYPEADTQRVSRYEELKVARDYGVPVLDWDELPVERKAELIAHRRVSMLEESHRRDIELTESQKRNSKA